MVHLARADVGAAKEALDKFEGLVDSAEGRAAMELVDKFEVVSRTRACACARVRLRACDHVRALSCASAGGAGGSECEFGWVCAVTERGMIGGRLREGGRADQGPDLHAAG